MNRFLNDEDFNSGILNGLKRHVPDLDIVRVQDVGLRTVYDHAFLKLEPGRKGGAIPHIGGHSPDS